MLDRQPTHFGGLTNLGSLLFERGRVDEARPYVTAAVGAASGRPGGAGESRATARGRRRHRGRGRRRTTARWRRKPDFCRRILGLAAVYEQRDEPERAQTNLDRRVCRTEGVEHSLPRHARRRCRCSLLISAFGGDMVTNLFFDDTVVQKAVLLADSVRGPLELPPYHVLFNGIGDADRGRASLERARAIAAQSPAPVINAPDGRAADRACRDDAAAARGIAGVLAPRTERIARADVGAGDVGAARLDVSALAAFARLSGGPLFRARERAAAEFAPVLERLPGNELFAIAFARRERGPTARAQVPRAIHRRPALSGAFGDRSRSGRCIISPPTWRNGPTSGPKKHAFLERHDAVLGDADGRRARRDRDARSALDYGGIDFGIDAAGNVVVFEANATMAIYLSEAGAWGSRRRAAERVIAAVRAMLVERATTMGYS